MKYRKLSKSKKWYDEISFGLLRVSIVGNGYGFIIPKRFLDKDIVEYGDKMLIIGIKRKRGIADELSKSELIEYERWKRLKEAEKQIIEGTLNKMAP